MLGFLCCSSHSSFRLHFKMAATRAKDAEQHTPFCEKDCRFSHHQLIKALFSFNNFSDGYSNPGHLHLFYENVQSAISQGWDKDSVVPDPSRDLQCPLLYLACAFGKHKALSLLLKMDFEPSICIRQTGETGLHAAVRYVYQSGAWSVNNRKRGVTKVRPKTRTSSFEKILESLCEKCPEIIGQKDINWDTPLHVMAQELAEIRASEVDCTGRKLLMALNNRKIHFEQCFRSMLLKVVQLVDQEIIGVERAMQIICCKNRERKSILNILSERSSDEDASLEFLKCILSKLGTGLAPNNIPQKESWLGTQSTTVQGALPPNLMMVPCLNMQSGSQVPIQYVYPQVKQARKERVNTLDGKHPADSPYQPLVILPSNAEGNTEESSIIHVVFGNGNERMTQSKVCPLKSVPESTSNKQSDVSMMKVPTKSGVKKQPQKRRTKSKEEKPSCLPQMDKICSTSMQNQSIPLPTPKNNVTNVEEPMVLPEKQNADVNQPATAVVNRFNSPKDNLRREIRETNQSAFALEKECFRLESERLECLHGIKERKESIENLQKQIVELEQKATILADSKSDVEKKWKAFQQKEKELKMMLFSSDPDTEYDKIESSKRLKLN